MEDKRNLLLAFALFHPGSLDAKITGLNYLELRLLLALYLAKVSLSTEQLVLLFGPSKTEYKNAVGILKDRSLIVDQYPAVGLERKSFFISEKGKVLLVQILPKIEERKEQVKALIKNLPLM